MADEFVRGAADTPESGQQNQKTVCEKKDIKPTKIQNPGNEKR
jgi:hypothetical protein